MIEAVRCRPFFAFLAAVLLCALSAERVNAQSDVPMSASQEEQIQNMIREFIEKNPEVILESIRNHRENQEAERARMQKQRLVEMREQLQNAKMSPVGGNPNGDVTVVEFFDYRCPYCKRAHESVAELLEADSNVRLVFKEFPILGPDSLLAARAALSVFMQFPEKYVAYNDALLRSRGGLDLARVLDIAAEIGLDADAIKDGMDDPKIESEIFHNRALAEALGITGTPAFVIADNLIPGAADFATLKGMVEEARKK